MLTPLETLLLNKQMPPGFKLELDEILIKEIEEKGKPVVHKKHRKGFNFRSDYPRKPRQSHKDEDTDNILAQNKSLINGNDNLYTEKKTDFIIKSILIKLEKRCLIIIMIALVQKILHQEKLYV